MYLFFFLLTCTERVLAKSLTCSRQSVLHITRLDGVTCMSCWSRRRRPGGSTWDPTRNMGTPVTIIRES